jgi:hypothetical protein
MKSNKIMGGVSVMGFIAPNSIYDTYPVIDPIYGIDGLRNVDTIDDMLAISFERRRAGMVVGIEGGKRFFKLKDIEWSGELSDWDELLIFLVGDKPNEIKFVDKEKPNGLIDGVNKIFELNKTPIPGSEHVFLNGILQDSGVEFDYILDEKIIIFNEAPLENMRIICSYRS